MNIVKFFREWSFNFRKNRAIKKADCLAQERRQKYLVLYWRKQFIVMSMQRTHQNQADALLTRILS